MYENEPELTEEEKIEKLCNQMKIFFDSVKSDDMFVVEVHKDYTYVLMA